MHNRTDEELMRLVKAKERAALEQLYDRYVKLVYSFARKSVGDEWSAREVVQAVFVRIWTTESGYRPEAGKFVNWLLTITRNAAIDHLRRRQVQERVVLVETSALDEEPTDRYLPEASLELGALREQVRQACKYLSDRQARLIELVYWQGYSLSEAAELCGEPLGTVKSRLHQALKILRMHLSAREEGVSR